MGRLLLLLVVLVSLESSLAELHRRDFPPEFFFGVASSAYQFEGAAAQGGRQPSIWDDFARNRTGSIEDGSSGDVAVDQYHRFKEDVLLLKNLGVDVYRFSISWSRFFPGGTVNKRGLDYYNSLIDSLLEHGVQPFVTLYHWDLPYALEESLGGWRNPLLVEEFKLYADACFQAFGDRVKFWITFNEPYVFVYRGHGLGTHAPGRCSSCSQGDSGTEPYIAAHHVLLAHAQVVRLYREKFQKSGQGKIGLTLNFAWYKPFSDSAEDVAAAESINAFELGWFLNPLVRGDYPEIMRKNVGTRLPKFTKAEARGIVNSFDFIGINHYTSHYAKYNLVNNSRDCTTDPQAVSVNIKNGIPIGPQAAADWQHIVPLGIYRVLTHVRDNYNNPEIIVTENGVHEIDISTNTLQQSLQDHARISFHQQHLAYVLAAMRDDVKVHGYIAWALTDNWEWTSGFRDRFGFYFIDYRNNLKRYPKISALWFRDFLRIVGRDKDEERAVY